MFTGSGTRHRCFAAAAFVPVISSPKQISFVTSDGQVINNNHNLIVILLFEKYIIYSKANSVMNVSIVVLMCSVSSQFSRMQKLPQQLTRSSQFITDTHSWYNKQAS
jgi:adenine-specific DNA methylase